MTIAQDIQKIETAYELRALRRKLDFDQAWEERPLWENEINDIDARLENLEAADSVERES